MSKGSLLYSLRARTEYSFGSAFGSLGKVVAACEGDAVGIADAGTWGHVSFASACKKADKKAILGASIGIVQGATLREKQPSTSMAFLAKNNAGLKELYEIVTRSTSEEQFYYYPRLSYSELADISDNLIMLTGANPNFGLLPAGRAETLFVEINPLSTPNIMDIAEKKGLKLVACSDNYYPRPEDLSAYEIMMYKNAQDRAGPMFLMDADEFRAFIPWLPDEAIDNTAFIAEQCNANTPEAQMVSFDSKQTIMEMCIDGAVARKCDLSQPDYEKRLHREINLIKDKKYEDYFYVIADLVQQAKKDMLVGPARGSSAGSLVCWLTGITDIDPIAHDLLFERFIDVTREDLPDIDIDFQDDKRHMVWDYLVDKYGADRVAKLGTISRFKARSTIDTASASLKIPRYEVKDLKDAIIERSGGDSRAAFCILDTFNDLDIGKRTMEKYPQLKVASDMENHARHTGVHAAGIMITEQPINEYCSVDLRNHAIQIDKKDAEALNLLKIDALGLRTLSVLQDCLDQIGMTRDQLLALPLDDQKAFDVFNEAKMAGIFQFEGYALKSVTAQMVVGKFEDIVAITALARPGPLNSGGTTEYLRRHTKSKATEYLHPMAEEITRVTYGVVVYQEQVMQIARHIGGMSWDDVSSLRKAMSKSLGKEFFDSYWEKFKAGAKENGIDEVKAREIWDNINTMGSWAFNRSHAVAYGLISYQCAYLKAHYPLEFTLACLRNAKEDDQTVKLLREALANGTEYIEYDAEMSDVNWSIKDGKLIGGLINIKGCGQKTAENIVNRRNLQQPFTPSQKKMLTEGTTPFSSIFECEELWGDIKADPKKFGLSREVIDIEELDADNSGVFVFFGKLKEKNLRDMNETVNLAKRGWKRVEKNNLWLNITLEDDTGEIICTIGRFAYQRLGKPIVETGKEKEWYLCKGEIKGGFRKIHVKNIMPLAAFREGYEKDAGHKSDD